MVDRAASLLISSLAFSTRKKYLQVIRQYEEFATTILGQQNWFPASVTAVALFMAYLIDKGSSSSTVATSLSALGYIHKLAHHTDPTSHFVIRKILAGSAKIAKSVDSRLPITVDILKKLLGATFRISRSHYEALLFRCMFIIMFYAFLRVGEATESPNNLQFSQVIVSPSGINITFYKFKHHTGPPIVVSIPASGTEYCPVSITIKYLRLRGAAQGPFFSYPGGIAVTSSQFSTFLSNALSWCGYQHTNIKPHSFRIGAATLAAAKGYSDVQIQAMGRWSSQAFKKYIRVQSFKVVL